MGIATIGLYSSGQDQIKLARNEFKLASAEFASTHRPKLILRQAFAPPQADGVNLSVQMVIANTGETNARIVESVAYIELITSREGLLLAPASYGRNDLQTANQVFAPGQERPFVYWDQHGVMWSEETKRYWAQPLGVHFVGRFVYVDEITGVRRQTAYRRWYDRRAERFIRIYENGTEHEYAD
jgi:hypothetical protein